MVIASAAEFRALAAQKLPQFLFDYIDVRRTTRPPASAT
jgi:hypothetical protein